MYCPECGAEYEPRITLCSDCHVTLVPELPADHPLHEIEWLVVAETNDTIQADMLIEVLHNNGISAYRKTDAVTTSFSVTSTTHMASVKILVPETEIKQAEPIVQTILGEK